jgi:hypothetical protein
MPLIPFFCIRIILFLFLEKYFSIYTTKMRSSYGGPGTSRSTWKPNQDPGKQAAAASANAQRPGKNDGNRPTGNTTHGQQSTQQNQNDEKKE